MGFLSWVPLAPCLLYVQMFVLPRCCAVQIVDDVHHNKIKNYPIQIRRENDLKHLVILIVRTFTRVLF